MDKKRILIIAGGILLLGGLGYYFYTKRKKSQEESLGSDMEDELLNESSARTSNAPSVMEDDRFNKPINPRLNFLTNKKVASYLSSRLSTKEMNDLRGWMELIKKEREKDPTKWGDANGLTGETSRVAGALYQMKTQKQCKNCWNNEFLNDFRDAN